MPDKSPAKEQEQTGVRLQKVLAAAGLGSRRACEEIIAQGRVSVDGVTVREQGRRVNPTTDAVAVDGIRLSTKTGMLYLALNKPRGVLSAMSDTPRPGARERPTIADYLTRYDERLFHVGRLDADTEGLLLVTNDGDLAHRLAHPSHGVPKTYLAEVGGAPARDLGRRLRAGIELDDGLARVDGFKVAGRSGDRVLLEIVLHEGRNHIVRRLLAEVGHPVHRLVRTRMGPVALGDLRPGRTRQLSREELGALFAAAGM